MTSIEVAASYATSPTRLSDNQWKAAAAPEPLTAMANQILQALRTTGQYMGLYAIMQAIGTGTPGEIRRALTELEIKGHLEEQPRPAPADRRPQLQEPAQEPSTPAPAPEGAAAEPSPQEPAEGDLFKDYTGAPDATYEEQIAASMVEEGAIIEKAAPYWQLQTGTYSEEEGFTVREHMAYDTEQDAILTGQQYLAIGEVGELAARVRQATREDQWGTWIAIRHPEAPSVNDTAQASR